MAALQGIVNYGIQLFPTKQVAALVTQHWALAQHRALAQQNQVLEGG